MEITNVDIVTVNREHAEHLLASYPYERQRHVNPTVVDFYATMMAENKWIPGSEIEIAYAPNGDGTMHGHLVNGQHRLRAVVKSGQPVRFVIKHIACADDNEVALVYGTIDTQRRRGISDYFRALALSDELGLVSSDIGRMSSAVTVIENNFTRLHGYSIENSRRLELIRLYSEVGHKFLALIVGAPASMRRGLRQASVLSLGLVTLDESVRVFGESKVEQFWTGLAFDDGLVIGDPRKTAYRHLAEITNSGTAKRTRIAPEYTSRYVANCFNAWTENRELKTTRVADASLPIQINGTHWNGK